jgi:hypothetical protein
MTTFTLEVGSLALQFTERYLLATPLKFGDGRHLRIDWEPQQSGGYAGLFTPHVTFPGRCPRDRRRTIGRFAPDVIRQTMGAFKAEVSVLWSGASRPTTLEQLSADEWLVVGYGDAVHEAVHQRWCRSSGTLSLPTHPDELRDTLCVLIDHAIEPTELESAKRDQPYSLLRVRGDGLQEAMVAYFPKGLFGPPGWYITILDDLAHQIVRAAVTRSLSGPLVRALMRLARYFRCEPSDELRSLALKYGSAENQRGSG